MKQEKTSMLHQKIGNTVVYGQAPLLQYCHQFSELKSPKSLGSLSKSLHIIIFPHISQS